MLFNKNLMRDQECRNEKKDQLKRDFFRQINRLVVISATAVIVASCHTPKVDLIQTPIEADGQLTVAIGSYTPGNVVIAGERYGYLHEVVDRFAERNSLTISHNERVPMQTIINGIADGSFEVGAIPTILAHKFFTDYPSEPYMTTRYVVMGRSGDNMPVASEEELTKLLSDKDILVDVSLTDSRLYNRLLDENRQARFYISSTSGYNTPNSLNHEGWDLVICQQSDAAVADALNRSLTTLYTFEDEVSMSLVFGNESAAAQFHHWQREFAHSEEYASLAYLYKERGLIGEIAALRRNATPVIDGISVWDDLLKKIAESEGVDWRLLSAIAYSESRFRADVVSNKGAVGLMQVMPSVASQFDVTGEQLANPETNIAVSIKVLKKINQTIGFGSEVTAYDRMAITLAAYNGGVGRIRQARRLLSSEGGNPDSWEELSQTLRLMADPDYIASKGGSVRRFGGSGQTLAYVAQVIGRYNTYCDAVE